MGVATLERTQDKERERTSLCRPLLLCLDVVSGTAAPIYGDEGA